MKLAITDEESIVGWLYPNAFGIPTPPDTFISLKGETPSSLRALFSCAIDSCEKKEAIIEQYTNCDVGVTHDAPDYIDRISKDFQCWLSSIPKHERWRVAENWARALLNRRLNKDQQVSYKKYLTAICELAIEANEKNRFIILIEQN
ncbi:MAG: hypothetical protein ACRBHB_16295 [Arenicella sp.]